MFKRLFIFFIFLIFPLFSAEKIVVYTLPKSGTNLLSNIFKNLKVDFILSHVTDLEGNNIFDIRGKAILNIRDLRDYFISLKNFTNKVVLIGLERGYEWPGFKTIDNYGPWLEMSEDEKLLALINLDPDIPYYENNIINNIKGIDRYLSQKNIIVTKYEDWIGERGGGSKKAFFNSLNKTLDFFGWKVGEKLKQNAYDVFYGDTITFDRGQMGYWKNEFKPEHKEAFKKLWNNYLVRWGYEKNDKW